VSEWGHHPGNLVTTTCDVMGRKISTTLPDATVSYTAYWPTGLVKATWGSQTYPTWLAYDEQNRQTQLHTWKVAPVLTAATTSPPAGSDLDHDGSYEFTRLLDRSRDALARDSGFILGSTPASTLVEAQAAYAYSPTDGRLAQISNPQISNQTFSYQYLPNSDLIEKVTGPIHTVTNTWEPNRDVLDTKQNKVGMSVISNYDYAMNALGQVTSADSSVNASDRAYQYDAIGNRKKSADSLSLPPSDNYVASATSAYSSVQLPGAATALTPGYDDDGNMTRSPLPVSPTTNNTLVWDGENRLTEVKNAAGTTLEKNVFDSGSRKIATTVGGVTTIYLYDAWNCIAEYTGTTLAKTRLWGMDLSGSMQGAGGDWRRRH
jgi:hypothetical protein